MAKVGAQRAAELTGISKSTIQRAMKSGKLSYSVADNGYREIDVSELERVYGLKKTDQDDSSGSEASSGTVSGAAPSQVSVQHELEKANTMIEMERLKMRIYMLEQQLEAANGHIDELKAQRDQWQKQASQVLITSQYSQKQAEELKEEIRQRDERMRQAKLRREQKMRAAQNADSVQSKAEPARRLVRVSEASAYKKGQSEQGSLSVTNASMPVQSRMVEPPSAIKAGAQPKLKSEQKQKSQGSFVDNSQSYKDLTQDARIAEAVKRESVLNKFVNRLTGKKSRSQHAA